MPARAPLNENFNKLKSRAMEMEKNVAIITGASGGIGRTVAIRLANDGFEIVVHYSGNVKNAEDIANVVSFLASPEGGWINAQVLRANGGFA